MQSPIFNSTKASKSWATIDMIEELRTHINDFENRREVLRVSGTDHLQYAIGWIIHRMDSGAMVRELNRLSADDAIYQVMVGKLALRIQIGTYPVCAHDYELIRVAAAAQILTTLKELGHIQHTAKVVRDVHPVSGKITFKTKVLLSFGEEVSENSMFIKGVHQVPGVVLQKRFKVRAGGKALKLNKAEKQYLKAASSTALRIIQIDPQEVEDYLWESEWAQHAQDPKSESYIDRIIMKDLINTQVKKFIELQKLDQFYLSMWMDYRTRSYYDISELGFNPHGKTFETSLYELAEARHITEEGYEDLAYSAVTIVDGRTIHRTAVENFMADPEGYVSKLRSASTDRGKNLYNNRLADAIEDYQNNVPSRFLLGEDATNGGAQHFALAFHGEKTGIMSNVGGADEQMDSHGIAAASFNMDRDEYKKLVSQGLFHGEAVATVAKKLHITTQAAKTFMETTFGKEIFNVETIADWGVQIATSENTSLMWTTRDGFRAQSIAYVESVPLHVKTLTSTTQSGLSTTTMHKEMPLKLDASGQSIYGQVKTGEGSYNKQFGGAVKVRGLFANITHSIDGTALRNIVNTMHLHNKGIMTKHDNFFCHPNDIRTVRHAYKDALYAEFNSNHYLDAMKQIQENYQGDTPPLPMLHIGTLTQEMLDKSHYYLAA